MNKQFFAVMLLLVVGTISIPAFADEDDVNDRDDDRDEYYEERESSHDEYDDDRDEYYEERDDDRNSSHEQREDHDERHDERYDERHDDDRDERHENRDKLHSQHSKQMTVLEDRIAFLEKQIEGKDTIISEQMKVIMMLVEQINKVVFDQIMMPVFGI